MAIKKKGFEETIGRLPYGLNENVRLNDFYVYKLNNM